MNDIDVVSNIKRAAKEHGLQIEHRNHFNGKFRTVYLVAPAGTPRNEQVNQVAAACGDLQQ